MQMVASEAAEAKVAGCVRLHYGSTTATLLYIQFAYVARRASSIPLFLDSSHRDRLSCVCLVCLMRFCVATVVVVAVAWFH